jgi:hypothetical protein
MRIAAFDVIQMELLMRKKIVFLLVAVFVSAGCTTAMKSTHSAQSKIDTVDFKNYQIGEPLSAYVGNPIITRKSYKTASKADVFQAEEDFSLTGGVATTSVNLQAHKGDSFRIAGKNELDNYVVNIPGSIFMFGISSDGQWDETVLSSSFWTSPIGSGGQYEMTPPNAKLKLVNSEIPLSEAGYINHEIIFTGIGANGISLLYREYTFENMARSDFKQELVYPVDSKEIRFRNYLLEVLTVSPAEIKYIVSQE